MLARTDSLLWMVYMGLGAFAWQCCFLPLRCGLRAWSSALTDERVRIGGLHLCNELLNIDGARLSIERVYCTKYIIITVDLQTEWPNAAFA